MGRRTLRLVVAVVVLEVGLVLGSLVPAAHAHSAISLMLAASVRAPHSRQLEQRLTLTAALALLVLVAEEEELCSRHSVSVAIAANTHGHVPHLEVAGVVLVEQRHAQHVLVEVERLLGVLQWCTSNQQLVRCAA